MINTKEYSTARHLPREWDHFTRDNIYLSLSFLMAMERVSKRQPKYYMYYENNDLIACFIVFKKIQNIFEMRKWLYFPWPTNFVYVLLSANAPGIKFNTDFGKELNKLKGLKVILNLDKENAFSSFSSGYYLSSMILKNKWSSFNDYLMSMRSNYRYRLKSALKKGSCLSKRILKNNQEFTLEMYRLYKQVYGRAKFRLDKLELDYFKLNFFKIIVFEKDNRPMAFIQLVEDGEKLWFGFVGFDYKLNHRYDLYVNALIAIVEYGINNGFSEIDLGQTAEDTKMKMGCIMKNRYACIGHSNKIMNYFIKITGKIYYYSPQQYNFHIFNKKK